ncbi:MAG: hypothetical protein QOC66_2841 [Pseudonocardiales bacterium]|nr:hypothetical protein [Pseudonocardiales bacterium]
MPSIEKRLRAGKVSWRAHYRTPEGRQRNRSFPRKIDAERFLTTVSATKLTGTFVDLARARMTVGEMAERWTASKAGLKASTRARYAAALDNHVLPRWRDTPLAAIDHEAVQDWISELMRGGMSPASVRKVYVVLSRILDVAVKGRLPANPARSVTMPRLQTGAKQYLTAAQVERMADAAATLPADRPRRTTDKAFAQYRLVVLVLAYCGLRCPSWRRCASYRWT